MKTVSRWRSHRLHRDVTVVRWGTFGTPVLLFPTAGGDAEEIERFHLVGAIGQLLDEGRVKLYSVDSVAGRAWLEGEGGPEHRSWVQNQFHEFIRHEVVPAIRNDCNSPDIETIAAGASIGAFNALGVVCRYPDVFRAAVAMSGTYDLEHRFLKAPMNLDFYLASPLHFVPRLEGPQLEMLRHRFIVLASGEGRWEDIGESWRMANVLGGRGIPNRVDSWGTGWDHDWVTWRAMLPRYLGELA